MERAAQRHVTIATTSRGEPVQVTASLVVDRHLRLSGS
jgi:hypothetical protein